MDWRIHVYIAKNCVKNAPQTLDSGEKISVESASFEDFITLVTSEGYTGGELAQDIMRMRLGQPRALAEFKSMLFGKNPK
jgi:hypothetical protein